ncbi:DNA repair protein RadA [Candidatus Falkowbacteria bacterium]|jgi:DNA repair protein RadA/Sms|nr:DNA repair protein RadA [Candidatus Falkowbacteria bacterium]MBT5503172.1 DNA repair protein RadA [Candidatus Falkowbacteria bacterium]MBT6574560.1 DNA repair protein RadA [Candidatus Falkowbacteria bacterium]MBT7348825.1 DNA repair protein RadA [Candidatus Falkowbacteria bacterium]MBT7500863.1 DNA repair protein RadA [Candidatus Falkowbacteria bacterium]
MNKTKTIFTCTKCDAQSPKWSGRCLSCGAWGTVEEAIGQSEKVKVRKVIAFDDKKLVDFNQISSENFQRTKLGLNEVDQIFGGGIVQGSITLIGGEPGIGKSTLVLQILKQLEGSEKTLLYISGEESAQQIKLRMDRLKYTANSLKFLSETNVEQICAAIRDLKPKIAIIDSIQTIYSNDVESEAGNVAQIRACTVKLLEVAKTTNTPVIITGHVTKDGSVAGPKTLEHLVDVVIYLEGDKFHGYRILRTSKNRFGSTNEIGVLEMTAEGLIEVKDPTKAFLSSSSQNIPGSVISCFMEGTRAFLVEVQALVTTTVFGFPQRKTSGYDLNRLQMIAAVLFKRAGLNLTNQDIHLNIVGGFRVTEPAIDLAVAMAIISALKNLSIPKNTIVIGELGLGGEIRTVSNIEKRIMEAEKLGFDKIIVPNVQINKNFKIQIQKAKNIVELSKLT